MTRRNSKSEYTRNAAVKKAIELYDKTGGRWYVLKLKGKFVVVSSREREECLDYAGLKPIYSTDDNEILQPYIGGYCEVCKQYMDYVARTVVHPRLGAKLHVCEHCLTSINGMTA